MSDLSSLPKEKPQAGTDVQEFRDYTNKALEPSATPFCNMSIQLDPDDGSATLATLVNMYDPDSNTLSQIAMFLDKSETTVSGNLAITGYKPGESLKN